MNILLAGASGQLGQELLPLLQQVGQVTTVDRQSGPPGSTNHIKADLTALSQVEILLNRTRPDLVVNAAAYTAVDKAEHCPELAFRLNSELPGCMARWAERNDRLLFHYSTDYIFNGRKDKPWLETEEPGPLNIYGESKLAGEWAIAASRCRHIILRTSWVYSSHGNNFVLSMLRLARERPQLSIVSDQVGCPTWARNLAQVSGDVLNSILANKSDPGRDGIYHYCDSTSTNWYDFARLIFSTALELGLLEQMPQTQPVKSSQYPQVAERPLYSVLDSSLIQAEFAIKPPGLTESLMACLAEI